MNRAAEHAIIIATAAGDVIVPAGAPTSPGGYLVSRPVGTVGGLPLRLVRPTGPELHRPDV
ncbi:hypothetical protein KBX50_00920 [Micromonospora sp. C51]|uniref:hypothetical protein n=1 Tax=Micromonospora sp. C51 TaxID=2824879 RepID=UPI001B35A792|nr:hypothetical protein [Micromonospora sp. C51]MBQ1047042.1 hypothetical protein [Micromonospora sp. C51]